ncbi:UNVERIFIED_CONTAM: hypothetical protein RKD50_007148 [Streptomyces canus]
MAPMAPNTRPRNRKAHATPSATAAVPARCGCTPARGSQRRSPHAPRPLNRETSSTPRSDPLPWRRGPATHARGAPYRVSEVTGAVPRGTFAEWQVVRTP